MTLYLVQNKDNKYLLTDIRLKELLNNSDKHYFVNIIATLYISDDELRKQLDLNLTYSNTDSEK